MGMFSRTYELPLAKTYVRHWGMAEAVREILQNAVDSESPFEYEFSDDTLTVRSRYAKLTPATLLLGATTKADSPDTIGSFGEGYKIALLVLLRAGYRVIVRNGDRTWTPRFKRSRQYDAEVLCIEDAPAAERHEGLAFVVRGLSPDDIAQIRESCLRMQADVGEVIEVEQGRILRERPGRLYIGGLLICSTELKFGYDVKPQHLRLERDRQTVSTFDLQWLAKEMWFGSERWDEIAQLMEAQVPDLEYSEHGAPELVKEACYRLFQKRHPGAVAAKTHDEMKQLVERGMTKVVTVESRPFYAAVTRAPSYIARPVVTVRTPAQVLEDWLARHSEQMHPEAASSLRDLIESDARRWRLQ